MSNEYGHRHTRSPEELKHLFTENQWNLIQESSKRNYISHEKILLCLLCKLKFLSSYETAKLLCTSSQTVRDYLKLSEKTYLASRKLNHSIKKLLEPDNSLGDTAFQSVKSANNLTDGVPKGDGAMMTAKPNPPIIYSSPALSPSISEAISAKTTPQQQQQADPLINTEPATSQPQEPEPSPDIQAAQEEQQEEPAPEQQPTVKRWVPI